MALYAIVNAGLVTDLVSPPDGHALADLTFLTAAQIAAAVAVPAGLPVGRGWTYSGGTFAPPAPPGPPPATTPRQKARAALAAGIPIASTATPALNGTYAAGLENRIDIQAQIVSILLNGTFTDGSSSRSWTDAAGARHMFTVAQFKFFATALAATLDALQSIIDSDSGSLPAFPVAIP